MKKRTGLGLALFFALGVLALTWTSFRANVGSQPGMPHRWDGLTLTHQVTGQEALQDVARLHDQGLPLKDASIGHYSGPGGKGQVWIGKAGSPQEAADLLQRMTRAINQGTSPFTPPQLTRVEGQEVYSTQGQGASHYYYLRGDRVLWVQIESGDPQALLREALKVF